MTQTGGLVILYAWLIFAGLLTTLAYLLLRHEQDRCRTSVGQAQTTRIRLTPSPRWPTGKTPPDTDRLS